MKKLAENVKKNPKMLYAYLNSKNNIRALDDEDSKKGRGLG